MGKAIADRKYKIKQLEAQIKKLEKEIEKIENGELVPERESEDSDSRSSIKISSSITQPLINPYTPTPTRENPYKPWINKPNNPYRQTWLNNSCTNKNI